MEPAGAMQAAKAAMSNTEARLLDKGLIAVKPDPRTLLYLLPPRVQ